MLSWRKAAMKVEVLPVAVGDGAETTLSPRAATSVAGHFGVQACFIDEDQMTNIPAGLLPSPKLRAALTSGRSCSAARVVFFIAQTQLFQAVP